MRARLSGVPFRLLGVVADPGQAADLCGHAFAHYAASGTDITLVCAGAWTWAGTGQLPAIRRLGVRELVLLDYDADELTAAVLEGLLAEVIASVRPHVVVADSRLPAVKDATASAFGRVRRAAGGSAALPSKLYFRPSSSSPLVRVSTTIAVAGEASELFVRAFPDPWVTGLLERDLFAGVSGDSHALSRIDERLAG